MSFARPLAKVTFFRTWHNMALVYQFAFYINDKGVQVIIRTLLCIKEVIFTNDAKTRLYGGVSQWTYTTLFCRSRQTTFQDRQNQAALYW